MTAGTERKPRGSDLIRRSVLQKALRERFGVDLAYLGRELQFCQELIDLAPATKAVAVPCMVGDIVYALIGGQVVPMQVQYIYFSKRSPRIFACEAVHKLNFRPKAIGKDVFLSEEAAREALGA